MGVRDRILIIEIDLTKELRPSSTGKTTIVATTGGPKPVPGKPNISVGVNVFKKRA